MDVVSIHQAKSTLSQLINRVAQGETIYIGDWGKAQVKLVPLDYNEKPKKQFGILAGKLQLPEGFDDPLSDDVLVGFEGK